METTSILNKSIQCIKGVGEARARLLKKLGINTIEDMLYHFPRDYEDRASIKKIHELLDEQPACFKGIVVAKITETRPRKGLTIQSLLVKDETGTINLTWFNQSYLKNSFYPGQQYMFYGKPAKKYKQLEIQNPIYEKLEDNLKETGKIVPIYPTISDLSQKILRNTIKISLDMLDNQMKDYMPAKLKERYNLAEINYALKNIHFPFDKKSYEFARRRLVFEELLLLQIGLLSIKDKFCDNATGIKFKKVPEVHEFINRLPFSLTHAQVKVFDEIERDMESEKIMNRLVQGDVGSGKTIVAGLAMFKAVLSGYQAAMMAPTSILAEQHYNSFKQLFQEYGLKTILITGSLTQKQKKQTLEEISEGRADIIIGTHALIEEGVEFNKLGLVVTDEQHRFGVRQRAKLVAKGNMPDILVMTATPIPRTLALILYGDLDISVIDEMPPGRKKIETYSIEEHMRERVNNFIKKQIQEGRQAYIVCPLVEESETLSAKSVDKHAEELSKNFHPYKVAYLHGKMKASLKEDIMREFNNGNINILVSTTVIEVGVNVPNASIMVVENAEKFGLAQLHQLRGRVGRGKAQSFCVLICNSDTKIAGERMRVMQRTNDGFEIAEKDLELRGTGEFFGTRQHGIPDLKIANLFKDIDILKEAQKAAKELLIEDRKIKNTEYMLIRQKVKERFSERADEISFN